MHSAISWLKTLETVLTEKIVDLDKKILQRRNMILKFHISSQLLRSYLVCLCKCTFRTICCVALHYIVLLCCITGDLNTCSVGLSFGAICRSRHI